MQLRHVFPNAVTLTNIAFGFFGIISAAEGKFERAAVLLFCGALCDLVDGRLARLLDATSKFGMELDSLSDAVSFGIAPAVLIYLSSLRSLGLVGAAVAVAYALCGVLRLARFNVQSAAPQHSFVGVPIPIAAGYILSVVMVRDRLGTEVIALCTLGVALSMVSTLKVPKFRKESLPFGMLVIGLALFVVFLAHPVPLTWHLWNGWNMIIVISNYVMLGRRGWLRPEPAAEEEATA